MAYTLSSMPFEDHYAVLGVRRASSATEIRKAYRRLVLKCHPDRHPGDAAAEEQFKRVTAAYEVIGDPERRKSYDVTLGAFEDAAAQSIAQAERRRREAAAAKREAVEARQTSADPFAASRQRVRRRGYYRLESNELQMSDVANGIALGAAAWAFLAAYGLRHDDALPLATTLLLSVAALGAGLLAYRAGQPAGRALEALAEVLGLPPWLEGAMKTVPMVAALGGAAVALGGAGLEGWSLFSWWSVPGMISAGCAGAVGSGFGRAFTSVAVRPSAKAFGLFVGAAVGGLVGGILALLFVSFGSAQILDNAVFDRMFGAAAGAALGGALASLLGSLRAPA